MTISTTVSEDSNQPLNIIGPSYINEISDSASLAFFPHVSITESRLSITFKRMAAYPKADNLNHSMAAISLATISMSLDQSKALLIALGDLIKEVEIKQEL